MKGRIVRPELGGSIADLPEIGRLHIGKKSDKGYPMSVDYFIPSGKYADLFTKALGEKPSTIQVVFFSDAPEVACDERYEYRDNAGALVAAGDGSNFVIWNGKEYVPVGIDKVPDLMAKVCEKYPTRRGAENWDIVLTLRFIVPAVSGVVGVWRFTTKGRASSVKNIRASFDGVQQLRGTVTGTVFDLSVQFVKSNKPGSTSRYPVVSLVANDNRVEEIREALASQQNRPLLLHEK